MGIYLPEIIAPRRQIGARSFDFDRQVVAMGIVNRTPDSFHDKGSTFALERAVEAVLRLVEEGADWVDIGGVPFGTDAPDVSESEEIDRILPVLEAVRPVSDVVISIDTYRGEVARRSIAAGADVINDTSGLQDPDLCEAVAESQATIVIAHSLATPPRSKVLKPAYEDVTAEVAAYLAERVQRALDLGIPPERIVIDPGHDLNKNTLHTLELTRRLDEITALGYPTLAATSNKDFIGESLNLPQLERLEGTLAATVVCILLGARIMRIHDLKAGLRAIRMTEAILGWRPPAYLKHNM